MRKLKGLVDNVLVAVELPQAISFATLKRLLELLLSPFVSIRLITRPNLSPNVALCAFLLSSSLILNLNYF